MPFDIIIWNVSGENIPKKNRTTAAGQASLASSLLIGLVFLASGSGKLLAPHEAPGQVVDFISAIAPQALLTPWVLHFLYNILVPYILPSAELILGIMLLIGLVPRLAAILCIPLVIAFASTNIWAITRGGYTTCASCFGIWENIFGHLTPTQSLAIDIVLFLLALTVFFLHPDAFLSNRRSLTAVSFRSRAWLSNLQLNFKQFGFRRSALIYLTTLSSNLRRVWKVITGDWRRATALVTIFFAIAATASYLSVLDLTPRVLSVSMSEVSDTSAVVTITLNKPRTVTLTLCDDNNNHVGAWSTTIPDTRHAIPLDGLLPATRYHFQVSLDQSQSSSGTYNFITMPPKEPPLIFEITISDVTDNSATVTWRTARPASTEIAYWSASSSEQKWIVKSGLAIEHRVTLTGLSQEDTYYFRIRATDAYGKSAMAEKDGVFSLAIAPEVTKRAPDFTLSSLDGSTVFLSQFKGKVVVLNFWNMWCSACRKELPLIQEVVDKQIPDTVVLNIHLAGKEETIRNYLESQGLNLLVLLDKDASVQNAYGVIETPTLFIIDGAGIIRFKNPRFSSAAELTNTIRKVLDSSATIGSPTSTN